MDGLSSASSFFVAPMRVRRCRFRLNLRRRCFVIGDVDLGGVVSALAFLLLLTRPSVVFVLGVQFFCSGDSVVAFVCCFLINSKRFEK